MTIYPPLFISVPPFFTYLFQLLYQQEQQQQKMKACVCVDYLSHEWSSNDLIQAHRELKRQRSKTQFNITTKYETATKKELKKLSIEKVRQIRYQNAIWRQMARSCTKTLSWSNEMIHPSSVNWYVA